MVAGAWATGYIFGQPCTGNPFYLNASALQAIPVIDNGETIGWKVEYDDVTITALKGDGTQVPIQNAATKDFQLFAGNEISIVGENSLIHRAYYVISDGHDNSGYIFVEDHSRGMSGGVYYFASNGISDRNKQELTLHLRPDAYDVYISQIILDRQVIPGIAIDEEHFPDANFRAYVKSYIDTNQDGYLSDGEIAAVTSFSPTGYEIEDLTGIELFTNLINLNCKDNKLTTLDLSQNTKLQKLYCQWNELANLNLSACTELTVLDCSQNMLTSLNLSNNTKLENLDCEYNLLTVLDLSKNTELLNLFCGYNQLTVLDLSQNSEIGTLTCSGNRLTSIIMPSEVPNLDNINCYWNDLSSEALDAIIASLSADKYGLFYYRNLNNYTEVVMKAPQHKNASPSSPRRVEREAEGNAKLTNAQIQALRDKNWTPYYKDGQRWSEEELNFIERDQVVAIDVPLNGGTTKLLVTGIGLTPRINLETGETEIFGEVAVGGVNPYNVVVASTDEDEEGVEAPEFGYYVAVDPATEGELTIPSEFTYDGIKYYVTQINLYAFATCDKLTKVNLPETLQYIDYEVFLFCSSLQSIHIPASVRTIAGVPFFACNALESITVDSENPYLSSPEGSNAILEKNDSGVYAKKHGVKKAEDEDDADELEYTLVAGCKNTVIPDNVTEISFGAFWGLSTLKSITIPENVEDLDDAFIGCENLRQIIMKSAEPPYLNAETFLTRMEGLSTDEFKDYIRFYIENGYYPDDVPEDGDMPKENAPRKAKSILARIKAKAAGQSTGVPEEYLELEEEYGEIGFDVYKHAVLCVPTGAKEAYSAVLVSEAKADGPARATTKDNENHWAWFTHIIEPTVIPESGVTVISYDEDYVLPEGVEAYIVVQSTDGETTAYVSVEEVEGAIPGGTAIIIKGEPGTEFYITPADEDDEVADVTGNMLVAVDEDTTVNSTEGSNNNYVLDENGNFVPANGDEVDGGGAILQIPTDEAPDGDTIVIDFDGSIANRITTILSDQLHNNAAIYDLQGRRITGSQLPKGVYIIGGRKVVIK